LANRLTNTVNESGVWWLSRSVLWTPRAGQEDRILNTVGTIDGGVQNFGEIHTSWWWRRRRWGHASTKFRSTTLVDWNTSSLRQSELWGLNSNILWTPTAGKTECVEETACTSVVSERWLRNVNTSWWCNWRRNGWRRLVNFTNVHFGGKARTVVNGETSTLLQRKISGSRNVVWAPTALKLKAVANTSGTVNSDVQE
jgi:hypothetical protein